ncbi:MAG: SDR family NAD(P)-dependent oxidoreductase [Pedobacter sp.]|nr:MAG: SDR family NAD(P)-dependent oxidoreductase [Pedobacter sp.]
MNCIPMSFLENKTVLITGATSGIGRAAAIAIASQGAQIIILARNSEKAEQLLAELPGNGHLFFLCNMLSIGEIKSVSERIKLSVSKLDILINNAGTWFSERQLTAEGQERTFVVNYLSYLQLSLQIKDLLLKSQHPQIINTTSFYHKQSFNVNDIQMQHGYSMSKAYALSKLYVILITRELARRWQADQIVVNCFDPGSVDSNFGRGQGGWIKPLLRLQKLLFGKKPLAGAKPLIHLSSSIPDLAVNGQYFQDTHVAEPSKSAQNDLHAAQLWDYSIELLQKINTSVP